MTGLSRQAFSLLHDLLFLGQQPQRTARPQLMPSTAQLGLFLFYIASTMGHKYLCMLFGITPSTCSEITNKMLKLVVRKLKRHQLAIVKFPNAEKMENFASIINQWEPQVADYLQRTYNVLYYNTFIVRVLFYIIVIILLFIEQIVYYI